MKLNKNFLITEENASQYVITIGNWTRQFVENAGRDGVVLGLSGGVDSAVVARLAQEAGTQFLVLLLPDGEQGRLASNFADALKMVRTFGFEYKIIDIGPACLATELPTNDQLVRSASQTNRQLAKINIAPRVRANQLYQVAQLLRYLVIGTDNMAEGVTGYYTKYGDGAYDFCPLSFLTKREVYILARQLGVIDEIVNKPPSANLYEGQTDEAELGFSYDNIDDFIINGSSGDPQIDAQIEARYQLTMHKRILAPTFND